MKKMLQMAPPPANMLAYHFCFFMLGVSSWVIINGVFGELSTLVNLVPEEWAIASQLGLIVQFSNVFPLTYAVLKLQMYRPFILAVSLVSPLIPLLLSFFWDTKAEVFGEVRSTMLLTLGWLGGGVGTLSNVLFWPFASTYPPAVLVTLSVGMAFSSVIPSCLTAIQKASGFGVSTYFLCLFAVQLLCAASFIYLLTLPIPQASSASVPLLQPETDRGDQEAGERAEQTRPAPETAGKSGWLLRLSTGSVLKMISIAGCYFMLPTILPYIDSVYPASSAYFWANLVGMLGSTSGRLLLYIPSLAALALRHVSFIVPVGCSLLLYIAIVPLVPSLAPPVTVFVAFVSMLNYCGGLIFGMSVTTLFRWARLLPLPHRPQGDKEVELSPAEQSLLRQQLSRWLAFSEQTGATLAAVAGFVLVNVCHVYKKSS